jgi:hypothetical protein
VVTTADGRMTYLKERITREIDRLVRNGEWRQHVDAQPK